MDMWQAGEAMSDGMSSDGGLYHGVRIWKAPQGGSKHPPRSSCRKDGARGDEGTQGETMSGAIGTMTSREACRVRARRMRHGGAGKQARGDGPI